jgi:hypothetical protein
MRIGNRVTATDRTFDGGIDEVLMFNYTLTPAQVTALYNNYTLTSDGVILTGTLDKTDMILDINFDDAGTSDGSGKNNSGTSYGNLFKIVSLDYVGLTNAVDYTLNTATGLLTIINTDYLYNAIKASYVYTQRNDEGKLHSETNYFIAQLGSRGLAGWLPAVIAITLGVLFLSYFMGKRRKY